MWLPLYSRACLSCHPPREIIPPCGGWRQKAIHYAAVRTSAVQIPSADTSSAIRIGNTFNTEYHLMGEGTRWGWQRTHYYTLHPQPQHERDIVQEKSQLTYWPLFSLAFNSSFSRLLVGWIQRIIFPWSSYIIQMGMHSTLALHYYGRLQQRCRLRCLGRRIIYAKLA